MSNKAHPKPELSAEWWLQLRPDGVGEADLARALKLAERVLSEWEDNPDPVHLEESLQVLALAARELKETRRALSGKEYATLRDLLEEAEDLAQAEQNRLVAEVEDMENELPEDAPADRLSEPGYLHKMLRKLPSKGPFCFSFSSSPEPEECRLFLRLRGDPRRLLPLAREVPGDGKPCCGRLHIAPEDRRTLLVSVESVVPSRLAFALRRYLHTNRIGRIKKVLVLKDGQMVHASNQDEDANDPEDFHKATEGAYASGLSREAPAQLSGQQQHIKQALQDWKSARAQAGLEVVAARGHASHPLPETDARQLEEVLAQWDEKLRASMDALLNTALERRDARATRLNHSRTVVESYLNFIATDPWLKMVDRTVVPDVSMRAPLVKALAGLLGAIQG